MSRTLVLMNAHTCKPCNVPADDIVEITEGYAIDKNRTYPYSEIHIVNTKEGHDYTVAVVESKKRIENMIKEKDSNEKQQRLDELLQTSWS